MTLLHCTLGADILIPILLLHFVATECYAVLRVRYVKPTSVLCSVVFPLALSHTVTVEFMSQSDLNTQENVLLHCFLEQRSLVDKQCNCSANDSGPKVHILLHFMQVVLFA
jgi:hypothetical protein